MTAWPILHIEFFDRARQFRRAYETLQSSGRSLDWAKYLLFYHAMELALKAYLVQQGATEKDLTDKFGHDMKKLVNGAVKRGLTLPRGSKEMIASLGKQPPTASLGTVTTHPVPTHIKIRYPSKGPVYSLGQFQPYMEHLFKAVADALSPP